MNQTADIAADIDALRQAQPPWRADNLGVRGNAVTFHEEQAEIRWPAAEITHRNGGISAPIATAAAATPPDRVEGG